MNDLVEAVNNAAIKKEIRRAEMRTMIRKPGTLIWHRPCTLEPGPITTEEVARIRAAKGMHDKPLHQIDRFELAGYQRVRDLVANGKSRSEIIRHCREYKNLGERNVSMIRHALLNRG